MIDVARDNFQIWWFWAHDYIATLLLRCGLELVQHYSNIIALIMSLQIVQCSSSIQVFKKGQTKMSFAI